MAEVQVLRSRAGRVKHGEKARTLEASHTIYDAIISWQDTEDYSEVDGIARSGKEVQATVSVPFGSDVTAQDRLELPDGQIYRIKGKPLERRNDLTGTRFRTKIHLVHSKG